MNNGGYYIGSVPSMPRKSKAALAQPVTVVLEVAVNLLCFIYLQSNFSISCQTKFVLEQVKLPSVKVLH